jgi:hypothetical protein
MPCCRASNLNSSSAHRIIYATILRVTAGQNPAKEFSGSTTENASLNIHSEIDNPKLNHPIPCWSEVERGIHVCDVNLLIRILDYPKLKVVHFGLD